MPTIEELAKKYGGGSEETSDLTTAPTISKKGNTSSDIDYLSKKYGGGSTSEAPTTTPAPKEEAFDIQKEAAKNRSGLVRGVRDVLDTGAHGLANATTFIADRILPENIAAPIRKSAEETIAADIAERKKYESEHGEGLDVGRLTGQMAATAPLVPGKVIQGIRAATGALPTIAATGQRIAAPLINRLGASVGIGAVGGGTYGAATSSANDKSTAENIGEGIITGALTGPAVELGATAAKMVLPTIRNMWASVNIGKLANSANLPPSAVKNVVQRLEDAGLTPQQAQAELNKMGPNATLMDLDPALTTSGSALAAMGGKPTSILKNRMNIRSETANTEAEKIMQQKLGPKPDIEAERENIVNEARRLTGPDYQVAHASKQPLDTSPIVTDIDKQLENAVGSKASILKDIKGYLFRTDSQGNKTLKNDAASLHEIRETLDDMIEKAGSPLSSLGKKTLGSVKGIRNKLDEQLKTIPEMASADAKFAERMTVKDSLDTGYKAFKRGTFDEFQKEFANATPEAQQAIKKGMRSAIGDLMELAQKGELSEAQRLFAKKSANIKKLQLAFGTDADEVLAALKKEASFRATEKAVASGSQTAERTAEIERYGQHAKASILGEAAKGAALDVVTGTSGFGTLIMGAKRLGGNIGIKFSNDRLGQLTEGSADILSRQGQARDNTISILEKVSRIQKAANPSGVSITARPFRLPTTLPAVIGETAYEKGKDYIANRR